MAKDFFNTLNVVDCNSHVEKKNGLSYLSWSWAWAELKKRYPYSYFTVYENAEGGLVWKDPVGAHVKTGVTVVEIVDGVKNEIESIEYLPIMDMRNKSIPYENITSMDVNKAVQRSLTKAAARHGLGLYIYSGEDIPEEDTATNADLIQQIDNILLPKVKAMSADEKKRLAETVIVPVIGGANYKSCKDTEKLSALLNKIKTL